MMRKKFAWLASVSLVTAAMLVGPPAIAKRSDSLQIGTFSGAFLAARVAEIDNDYDSAIDYYKRALEFDPGDEQLQQSLMLVLISDGRLADALPYAQKLKSVAEIERFSRVALAVDAIHKQDYKAAERWLRLASGSDLDRLLTGMLDAWAKAGDGEGKEAVADLQKLGGPDWFDLFTTFHRGLIAEKAGLNAEAEKAYKATIDNVAAGSAAPETWLRASEAYASFLARKGDKKQALGVLDKAEDFATGRVSLGELRKDIEAGKPISTLVATVSDGASEALLDIGSALNRGGGEPFVRIYLEMALALSPESDAVLLQLASFAEQQNDPERAIELYARIPENSPLKRAADLQRGLNLADLKRQDEAITQLTKLLADDPADMRTYLALGGVYSSKEDYKAAADLYDKAVDRLKNPTSANWNIFYQRGIAYERLKQWPKAEPSFRKALELFPDQPQVMNYLGYSLVDMNMDLDEALGMIRKAVEQRPSDGYIVDSLGWAYFKLGRFDEAAVELERAVSLKPDDAVLNDHLGDAYWRVGRRLEATFQWHHARDMKPDPDVLVMVQKKLKEGLPPLESKTVQEAPKPAPQPVPDKKS